jgi:integrase/recombinase XerD
MEGYYPVHVSGPLEPYALGFRAELAGRGYTPFSARGLLSVAAHLSGWMAERGVAVAGLSQDIAGRYLADRRAAGYAYGKTVRILAPLMAYLREEGAVAPAAGVAPKTATGKLADEFRGYLAGERGLTVPVARGYADDVRAFLAGRETAAGLDLAGLRPSDVTGFILAESSRLAPKTLQHSATSLRALLVYLHVRRLIPAALAGAVPAAARRPGLVLLASFVSSDRGCSPLRTAL